MQRRQKPLPETAYLRECFRYVKSTGLLYWKARPRSHFASQQAYARWLTLYAGTIAGSVTTNTDGHVYLSVSLGSRAYLAHRLIWKLVTGNDPGLTVDHRNGCSLDNRWRNLRLADHAEQTWNTRLRSTNTSGVKGVSWDKRKQRWRARVTYRGKYERRYFEDFQAAECWIQTVRTQLHKLFANHGLKEHL